MIKSNERNLKERITDAINLIKLDIKLSLKSLIIWLAVMVGLSGYSFVIFIVFKVVDFDTLLGPDFENFGAILRQMMSIDDILNYYVTQVLYYQIIAGAVFAAVAAMGALLKDEARGTTEFIYAHPISRDQMYFSKLAASQVLIFAFNLIYILAAFVMLTVSNFFDMSFGVGGFFAMSAIVWLSHIVMGLITYGAAGLIKGKNYLGIAIAISLILIIMGDMLGGVVGLLSQRFRFFEIFNHFRFSMIVNVSSSTSIKLGWITLLIYLAAGIALVVLGHQRYRTKNLNC